MSGRPPFVLSDDPGAPFPPAALALREPDGLLAMGGDLRPQRLLNAYRSGIFPWYSRGQPILWWSPDPRLVFRTSAVHLSTRFRRWLRNCDWHVHADTAFAEIVRSCARSPRPGQPGTWITPQMQEAYLHLHHLGHAHSIEVRDAGGQLAGGLYGVAVGRMFFGESMFSASSGGSKVALAALAMRLHGWGWPLLDAQVENPHLMSLGAERWARGRFLAEVGRLAAITEAPGHWTARFGAVAASGLAQARRE